MLSIKPKATRLFTVWGQVEVPGFFNLPFFQLAELKICIYSWQSEVRLRFIFTFKEQLNRENV